MNEEIVSAWMVMINAAQKFVKLVCYSIDPGLCGSSLHCALNRGVSVSVVSDQLHAHHRGRMGQSLMLRELLRANADVRTRSGATLGLGDGRCHAKMLITESGMICGSGDFVVASRLNLEVACLFKADPAEPQPLLLLFERIRHGSVQLIDSASRPGGVGEGPYVEEMGDASGVEES